ncbi:MAG: carbohydrate ABC transporter permease [Bacillota bacterium]
MAAERTTRPAPRRLPAQRPVRRSARRLLLSAARHLFAWALGLLWVIPFAGVAMTALRPQKELLHGWWQMEPLTISLNNFAQALDHPTAPMAEGLRNSLLIAIPGTVLPLLIGSAAAYGLLRSQSRVRRPMLLAIVLLLAIPQQMVAVPLFRLLRDMGLINNYVGLILAHTAWALPWLTMFFRNYFLTLPREVEEAALLDGASRWQVFTRMVLPMSLPALASAAALQLTWVWNDFFLALILIYKPDLLLATQRIPLLRGQYHIDWGVLSAASILTMSVPVLVFALLQRYYIRGLVGWTLK